MLFDLFSIKYILAVIVTAFIIKILDDYIDLDQTGFSNIVERMDRGILPYSLILLALAALLNKEVTISLIVASYIVGMIKDFNRSLSFKLTGYHEAIIIGLLFGYLLGIQEFLSSLIIILTIQLLDDIIDVKRDRYFNNKNMAIKYGIVEVAILSIILILLSFKMDYFKTIVSLMIFIGFEVLGNYLDVGEKEWI